MTDIDIAKAVAEACGIKVKLAERGDGHQHFRYVDRFNSKWWDPANDWNDAMLAAETCGLLKLQRWTTPPMWQCVLLGNERFRSDGVGAEHEDGRRAICEAVLKLKGAPTP